MQTPLRPARIGEQHLAARIGAEEQFLHALDQDLQPALARRHPRVGLLQLLVLPLAGAHVAQRERRQAEDRAEHADQRRNEPPQHGQGLAHRVGTRQFHQGHERQPGARAVADEQVLAPAIDHLQHATASGAQLGAQRAARLQQRHQVGSAGAREHPPGTVCQQRLRARRHRLQHRLLVGDERGRVDDAHDQEFGLPAAPGGMEDHRNEVHARRSAAGLHHVHQIAPLLAPADADAVGRRDLAQPVHRHRGARPAFGGRGQDAAAHVQHGDAAQIGQHAHRIGEVFAEIEGLVLLDLAARRIGHRAQQGPGGVEGTAGALFEHARRHADRVQVGLHGAAHRGAQQHGRRDAGDDAGAHGERHQRRGRGPERGACAVRHVYG